jgi:hypothetical protein
VDYYEALQARAMHAVLFPDRDAFLRHVKRFYSKTFATPLSAVDDLDEEFVLQTYYEEAFSQMDEDARDEYISNLLATPEEREALAAAHERMDERDEEFMKKLNKDVAEGKRRGPPPERPKMQMPSAPVDPKERAKAIKERIARGITTPEPAAPAPPAPGLPPDIHMSFDDGNLPGIPAEWLSMDPSSAPSRKK